MNWQDIKVSADNTHFLFGGKPVFGRKFIEVIKFHSPGLAPVKDDSGSYHIEVSGKQLYTDRFTRTFGYYCNRAAVVHGSEWFHLTEKGTRAYKHAFGWAGNYQENLCAIRDTNKRYYHIDLDGKKVYKDTFVFCGDFKDGYACVKTDKGYYKHLDTKGNFLNEREFLDLGTFHKNFATAKDDNGWHHIDKNGKGLYNQRYLAIEPFYNGFAVVTEFDNNKVIIDEQGQKIISV